MPHKSSRPLLSIRQLKLERGDTEILKGIDWRINTGEHWAILGANGCGKTSLLTAITAYLSPNSGEIELLGERYGEADWQELRTKIGMVTHSLARRVPDDEPAIETVLSGSDAQLGYWSRDRKPPTEKALRCLGKLKVRPLANRTFGILSQGERQKVFIARALMSEPKLLILDEPCAGLDPVAREQFLDQVDKFAQAKRGPSLILVTHHIEEIIPAMTHVLILKKGKVLAAGPKAKVLNSSNLSKAFNAKLSVRKNNRTQRYTLSI